MDRYGKRQYITMKFLILDVPYPGLGFSHSSLSRASELLQWRPLQPTHPRLKPHPHPSPQHACDDAPDHLHRSGLLINDEDDALYLTKSMPGLGVEDIHVEINKNNTLIIKGSPGGYETVLHLPPSCRKEEGWFNMKNGVLRPKEHKSNGPNDQVQSGQSPCVAEGVVMLCSLWGISSKMSSDF
ncbi:hypothetical protein ACLB2K_008476 [Fragaria x ananassa]